jgi:hypothetical protein
VKIPGLSSPTTNYQIPSVNMIKSMLTAVPPVFPQYAATPRCWKIRVRESCYWHAHYPSNADGIELRTISRDAGHAQSGAVQAQEDLKIKEGG